nr:hypothetical protein [Lachnospiraceae bacterium]
MSRFSVETNTLKNAAGRCDGISSNIRTLAVQIISVKNALSSDFSNYPGVLSALDTCITNASNCSQKTKWYGINGVAIAGKYQNTEDTVLGGIEADKLSR